MAFSCVCCHHLRLYVIRINNLVIAKPSITITMYMFIDRTPFHCPICFFSQVIVYLWIDTLQFVYWSIINCRANIIQWGFLRSAAFTGRCAIGCLLRQTTVLQGLFNIAINITLRRCTLTNQEVRMYIWCCYVRCTSK